MRANAMFAVLLLIGLCSLTCQQLEGDLLRGNWQAAEVLEEGRPLGVDPSLIRMQFAANGKYTYSSTLNYQEAGTYYLEDNYLFTTDTLNQASTEKTVEIILLSDDSLHLKMMDTGKERLLKLFRQ
ncbi:MAG TPA: hypothetical protein PKA00_20400 [Saprospiraceae bacterium]|nr:hypothetical protein [Saprospiraceae bacterium]HMQ85283.1 hypothetical protein [Saprospiraceae bacterium]